MPGFLYQNGEILSFIICPDQYMHIQWNPKEEVKNKQKHI